MGAIAVLLIILGLGQLSATYNQLRGLSLVGPHPVLGTTVGILLLATGLLSLPATWLVLGWVLPMGIVALGLMILGGSFIWPPRHPDHLVAAAPVDHRVVEIPDGAQSPIPGVLLTPPNALGPAVCIVPGAGDTKLNFKWRLIKKLLAAGLTVLSIDPPGHGDYRGRVMAYPDCLSVLPAALTFLNAQAKVTSVGVIGVSLGGASRCVV